MLPQSPRKFQGISVSIASGATGGIVTGVASQVVYLGELHLEYDAAGSAGAVESLEYDDASLTIIAFPSTVGVREVNFNGLPLAVGKGCQLRNGSTGAVAFRGMLSYDQY